MDDYSSLPITNTIHSTITDDTDIEMNDLITNIKRCIDAINLDAALTYELQKTYWAKRAHMFSAEDSLLSLSSSDTIDGIFYSAVLRITMEDSRSVYLARYFQFGKFEYFMETHYGEIKEWLGCSELLPYSVYTKEDVASNSEREAALFQLRRKPDGSKASSAFQRKLFGRKNGFSNSIKKIVEETEDAENVSCVFVVALCIDKNQKFRHCLDKDGNSKHRYFVSYPEHLYTAWEEKLMLFRCNPTNVSQSRSLWKRTVDTLAMEDQYFLLSSIPNFHKWPWEKTKSKDLRYEQRFSTSCRYYPGSPRNRIIQAMCYRDNPWPIVHACMLHVAGSDAVVPYEASALHGLKHKMPTSRGQKTLSKNQNSQGNNEASATIDVIDETANCNDEDVDDMSSETSINECPPITDISSVKEHPPTLTLYQHFCYELFAGGVLKWRTNNNSRKVVVMNDYNCETGDFQPNEYVHASVEIDEETVYRCSCMSYTIRLPNIFSGLERRLDEEVSCCHCQLLKDVMSLLIHHEVFLNVCINKDVVKSGLESAAAKVILLPSKSTEKYSVVSEESTEFVHVFTVAKTGRKVVACQSKLCSLSKGSKRSIGNLNVGALCSHLKVFKSYYKLIENLSESDESEEDNDDLVELVDKEDDDYLSLNLPDEKHEDVFNESSGLWNFAKNSPSQRVVSRDPFDISLKKNIEKRFQINLLDYESGTLSFSPRVELHDCDCGAGWFGSTYPDGILIFSHNTNLYLDRRAICCRVFIRKCLESHCILTWDGEEDSIFRLSRSVCAGYELGWEFVDTVMSSKGTFRGFVTMYNNKYKRGGSEIPFMSLQTFINWFFGWASRMKVDFRQQCHWCGSNPSILACDGTKIGIGFKNTFVTPIEAPSSTVEVMKTPNRRHQRCFVANKKGKPSTYAAAREQLKNISSSIISGNPLQSYNMDLKQFLHTDSHDAFDAMLDCSRPLSERQLFAKVFSLLSSDASLDTVLPLQICSRASEFCRLPSDSLGSKDRNERV